MNYYINFGSLRNINPEIADKLIEDNKESDRGIGLHKIFPNELKFDKLDDRNINQRERDNIISDYWNYADSTFMGADLREESWVSDHRLNPNKGYCSRHIKSDFIEEFKKNVRGGREFFRSIRDAYTDNSTHPDIEVSLINTEAFKESLQLMSKEALNNPDLNVEQIDFIKWFYWWGTKLISRKKNLAAIRFSKE